MAIDEKGGMTIPDGIDDVLAALPSSIPPEMFDEDESAMAIPAIPRAAVPRPMSPPIRMRTPPPLPARARGAAPEAESPAITSATPKEMPSSFPACHRTLVHDMNRAPTLEPAPARSPRPSQRPTLSPDAPTAVPPFDPAASQRVPLASPSSMSAVVVPAAFDSRQQMATFPSEDSEDDIVIPGVSRPPTMKKLLAVALAAAVTLVVAQKVQNKLAVAVSAPPVAARVSTAPTHAQADPAPANVGTPPATPSNAEVAAVSEPEPAATTAPPSDHGSIDTAKAMAGRRVFVDGHVVGQTPSSMLVKCGPHKVKVGSAGHARKIDVPCGGSIAVGDF